VAAAQAGAGFGNFGVETRGRARVGNLGGAIAAAVAHGLEAGDTIAIEIGMEGLALAGNEAGFGGAALGAPFGTTAGKDADIGRAHGAEGPPDAGGREQA
jgi:hypothetical protein